MKHAMSGSNARRWDCIRSHVGAEHATVKRMPTSSSFGMRRRVLEGGNRHGLCTEVKYANAAAASMELRSRATSGIECRTIARAATPAAIASGVKMNRWRQ